MTCDLCGKKGARVQRITRSCGRGRSAFLVEGVPLVKCRSCGGSYFTTETLQELDRIRVNWRRVAVIKKIPVAKFGGAA